MKIPEITAIQNGKPTGYSFIYSSNQNSYIDPESEDKIQDKKEAFSGNYSHEDGLNIPEMELFKDVLYILSKLNAAVIAPYYDFNIKGITRVENDKADILLCNNNNASDWSLLHSGSGNGITLIDRSGITELAVAEADSPGFKFNLEIKSPDNASPEPNDLFKEDYRLTSLEALQDYMMKNSNSGNPSIREMEENGVGLEKIQQLIHDIFQQKENIGDLAQKAQVFSQLEDEITSVKQKVEQLTR